MPGSGARSASFPRHAAYTHTCPFIAVDPLLHSVGPGDRVSSVRKLPGRPGPVTVASGLESISTRAYSSRRTCDVYGAGLSSATIMEVEKRRRTERIRGEKVARKRRVSGKSPRAVRGKGQRVPRYILFPTRTVCRDFFIARPPFPPSDGLHL